MANTNAPFGLSPLGLSGTTPNFEITHRPIASNNATKIAQGDPLKLLSTGYVAQWTNGTTASAFAGVFIGCKYLSVSQGRTVYSNFWPGSDAAADPDCEFISNILYPAMKYKIQVSTTPLTFANTTKNADMIVNAPIIRGGFGLSQVTLDSPNIATTATFPLRIVDYWKGVGNGSDTTTNFNWMVVQANTAALAGV